MDHTRNKYNRNYQEGERSSLTSVGEGTDNPFTGHRHYREYADYGVYRYHQIRTSRIYQRTGYIKLAYTFDFGEKISRDSKNINTTINSAILKAE